MYVMALPGRPPAIPCSRTAGEQYLVAGRLVVLMVFVLVLLQRGIDPAVAVGAASALALVAARTRSTPWPWSSSARVVTR